MSDGHDVSRPVSTAREFTVEDLAFINRMITTGQVLPSVAHELNNSLQIIAGMVEILAARGQLTPDTADRVQKIGVQATKAADMLRDLVGFARRDGVVRKVDVRTAVDRAVGFRRYYLSRGRVTLDVISRQDAPLVVQADSLAVLQVLVNLLLNAEESVAASEIRQVTIETWRDEALVHCQVRDSGPGFAGASHLDQPFATTKAGGTAGLGLAVARRLVQRDGGQLEIEGPGSTQVTVTWPATTP